MVFLRFGSRPSSHYQPEGPILEDQSRRPYLNPAPTIYIINQFRSLKFPPFFRLLIHTLIVGSAKIRGIYVEIGIYLKVLTKTRQKTSSGFSHLLGYHQASSCQAPNCLPPRFPGLEHPLQTESLHRHSKTGLRQEILEL